MRILVTGAKGFVGKNLCYALNSIKDGKDRTRPDLKIDEVYGLWRGTSALPRPCWIHSRSMGTDAL